MAGASSATKNDASGLLRISTPSASLVHAAFACRMRPAERVLPLDGQYDAGAYAELAEVAQRGAVPVGYPPHAEPRRRFDIVEPGPPPLVVRAVPRGDGVAVRIVRGVPERGVDALLEPLGEHVLQQLGFGVHLVPRHAEHLVEERLQQPVAAHDAQRGLLARRGEPQLAPARAVDELALLQPLDHGGDRGRRDAQLGRQQPGGHRLTPVGDVVDRLEVVLARAGKADHPRNVGASTD